MRAAVLAAPLDRHLSLFLLPLAPTRTAAAYSVLVSRSDHDVGPIEALWRTPRNPPLLFPPGTGGVYSSTNFVLLGLILQATSTHTIATWTSLDQRAVFGEARGDFPASAFGGRGKCARYAGLVHGIYTYKDPRCGFLR